MKPNIAVPRTIAIIVAIVSIVGIFLTYIGCTNDYAKKMEYAYDEKPFESVDITGKDMMDLSLAEYAKVYWYGGEEIFRDHAEGIFYAVVFAAPGIFGFFALLCALCKKGFPMILQGLLMGGSLYLVNLEVVGRGTMPSFGRIWGIAHWLHYPLAAILFLCGLWIFVIKAKMKKKK